jgi:hypothetical protein
MLCGCTKRCSTKAWGGDEAGRQHRARGHTTGTEGAWASLASPHLPLASDRRLARRGRLLRAEAVGRSLTEQRTSDAAPAAPAFCAAHAVTRAGVREEARRASRSAPAGGARRRCRQRSGPVGPGKGRSERDEESPPRNGRRSAQSQRGSGRIHRRRAASAGSAAAASGSSLPGPERRLPLRARSQEGGLRSRDSDLLAHRSRPGRRVGRRILRRRSSALLRSGAAHGRALPELSECPARPLLGLAAAVHLGRPERGQRLRSRERRY